MIYARPRGPPRGPRGSSSPSDLWAGEVRPN